MNSFLNSLPWTWSEEVLVSIVLLICTNLVIWLV